MASIRYLKKDIDYLMSLVLEDCIFIMQNHTAADKEKVFEIAQQIILDHRSLREKVSRGMIKNNRDKVKGYLSSVVDEMHEIADKSLDQLSALIKSKNG